MKKFLSVVMAFLVLCSFTLFALGSGSGDDEAKPAGTYDGSTTKKEELKFKVGEKANLNNVIVTLVSVEESNGTQYNKPTEGNVFLICTFEIENNSDSDIAVSSMLSFEAYVDGYSQSIDIGALTATSKKQLDGSVAAGKKMNGVVGYQAPKDWKEIEIRYTPDYWNGSDIIFVGTQE